MAQSHMRELPRVLWVQVDQCQVVSNSQHLAPSDLVFSVLYQAANLNFEPTISLLYAECSPVAICNITQPYGRYSFYRSTEGGRLSWPGHCSKCAADACGCVSQWFLWKYRFCVDLCFRTSPAWLRSCINWCHPGAKICWTLCYACWWIWALTPTSAARSSKWECSLVLSAFSVRCQYNLSSPSLMKAPWQFRRALKTYLFGWLRLQHLVTVFCSCYTNDLTYLLSYDYNLESIYHGTSHVQTESLLQYKQLNCIVWKYCYWLV